jgi:hypothetical protein
MARHRKPRSRRLASGLIRLARAAKLVSRPEVGGASVSAEDLAVLAAAALNHPFVPETIDDIDPRRQPTELPARTTTARAAVDAVHADWPGQRRVAVEWTFHPDGATGRVPHTPDVSDDVRRGTVAAYAAALGAQRACSCHGTTPQQ